VLSRDEVRKMLTDVNLIFDSALALPKDTKEALIEKLIASIDEDDTIEVSAEWKTEIKRRWQDYLDGKEQLHDGEEVIASLRNRK
jgi:putative addiction module component (TIGR02574 family)